MCGISGIYSLSKEKIPNLDLKLNFFNKTLKHRGPDFSDIWVHESRALGLGHTRLSIIDLSQNANQPMKSRNGNVIVFNGEIYNFDDLKDDLKKTFNFKSKSDTEVILAGYEKWGIDVFNKLNGMFAFVLWDENKKKLFCVRDRFGIKPFFYSIINNCFYFASEAKSLLPFLQKIETNNKKLLEYLVYQFNTGSETLFSRIHQLEPGKFLEIDKSLKTNYFWKFPNEITTNYDKAESDLYRLLHTSIQRQTIGDVDIGSYLSGGLDSSLISTISNAENSKVKDVFHGNFVDNKKLSELSYAKVVAKNNNLNLNVCDISENDLLKNLNNVIHCLDFPVAGHGAIPQFILSNYVSKKLKVVLGGQGGDEIFGGYAKYLIVNLEYALKNQIDGINMDDNNLSSMLSSLKYLKNYKDLISSLWKSDLFNDPDSRYFSIIDRSKNIRKFFLFSDDNYNKVENDFINLFNNSKNNSLFQKMTNFDIKYFLPSLLHVEDRVSMNFGLESRVPFLDNQLIDFILKLPSKIRFNRSKPKNLLINTFKNLLPNKIIERKDKMGFPTPFKRIVMSNKNNFFKEIIYNSISKNRSYLDIKELRKINFEQIDERGLWALISIELWHQNFHESIKKVKF